MTTTRRDDRVGIVNRPRPCRDCGAEFMMADDKFAQLHAKYGRDFVPPTRCKACGEAKRRAREREQEQWHLQ